MNNECQCLVECCDARRVTAAAVKNEKFICQLWMWCRLHSNSFWGFLHAPFLSLSLLSVGPQSQRYWVQHESSRFRKRSRLAWQVSGFKLLRRALRHSALKIEQHILMRVSFLFFFFLFLRTLTMLHGYMSHRCVLEITVVYVPTCDWRWIFSGPLRWFVTADA